MAHAIAFARTQTGSFDPPQLDGNRIAAGTGAIAINAALLLLLLAPLSAPQLLVPPRQDGPVVFEIVRTPPPANPPPIPTDVVQRPQSHPTPTTPAPVTAAPPLDAAVDPMPGDTIAMPAEPVADSGSASFDTTPSGGAQLQAVLAPPPPYPAEAMRAGLGGTVELEILVGIDGKPIEVRVVRSSGHRVLDQAARRAVMSRWTFQPAMRDGQPVQALGRVPIEFKPAR